jgi:hypothetical protein
VILRKQLSTYLILVLFQLLATPLFSQQSIVATAEKKAILLGEPLTIKISIIGGQPYKAVIPDSLGRFEVLERLPATTTKNDGRVTTTEQIVVTSFDSGALRIPPIAVEGNPSIVSPGIDVTVNTLPADAKTNYGDIKQIIDLQPPKQWPYVVALLVLMFLSAYMIYRLNKKYKKEEITQTEIAETISPNSLIQRLEQLKLQWLQQQVTALQLGNQLMAIFKKYLAGRGIYSSSKTGEELVLATKQMYEAETWQEIVQTIRLCNAMRFGKYNADEAEGVAAVEAFEKAVAGNRSLADNRFQPSGDRQTAIADQR